VYLVFDRYDDFSTKSVARGRRETGVTRTHQLRIETKLPAQNVVLTGAENKKQLISIIFGELIRDRLFLSNIAVTSRLVNSLNRFLHLIHVYILCCLHRAIKIS